MSLLVIHNVYALHEGRTAIAVDRRVIDSIVRAALAARAAADAPLVGTACSVLHPLLHGAPDAAAAVARSAGAVQMVIELSAADSDDVRGPAAELLLALFADGGARPALLRAGAVGALERLAAASWSELVAARAKQALGEFHEEDSF